MDRLDVLKSVALTEGGAATAAALEGATATGTAAQTAGIGIRDTPPAGAEDPAPGRRVGRTLTVTDARAA